MTTTREFLVPDLGEGLEDATITSWAVDVGDEVALNQTLCTVETNKAEVEIPSPFAGRIAERGGVAGETLPVGALLVRIETAGESGPPRQPVLVGYGTDETMDRSRRRRVRTKPPVRKLAAELGVDLGAVGPSGPDGIVTRGDVVAAASGQDAPVTGVRLAMARRMALSRREFPDANASVDVDASALLALRDECVRAGAAAVTPFVLVLRFTVAALRNHPELNATWLDTVDGPRIHHHPAIHLGVAVAAPRGLLVPVVTDAHRATTRTLAEDVARLVTAARDGTATPAELQGSTFTVSNFGSLGLDDGTPVINHPEAAILGVGSLKERAVVVDGQVVARPTMRLTCAFDHRVADGAQAGAFLAELRSLIESPARALLDL
ncbi:2-oxo acid dehydrogenase subunit E2 [Mycolicibacterium sp. 018/SC-01/001]|uniref:dihydrolipoamide acetyltransferase family protein n=1 Tax=Mycolicibacterium sp. 018/SC-01/001 TaxID=2592069 RepID=UPI00118101FA|nr:dihydrolipoamide acetyltransferase family protein [Mycolicibacterium sp. 018/SC-01/001]TRW88491.1 2-oxo acid dehydrogenase subunit E2 [Mycolicibacterium sp. 018/SC-01/001]